MIRRLIAAVAIWGTVLAGPILIGPAVPVILGHAQFVTSVPGAGEVVSTSPAELRLVFSETLDPSGTSVDLLDPDGATILAHVGSVDAADKHTLVVALSPLRDGVYTVDWTSLSAADGHQATGFFTFGVGSVAPPTTTGDAGAGSIHAGHDAATALIETQARIVGDLGMLLGFGLPIILWLVLRAGGDMAWSRVISAMLALGAGGSAALLVVSATRPGLDAVAFATGNRTGLLLLARVAIGAIASGVVWGLGPTGRRLPGMLLASVAAVAMLGLLAAGSHAAAYTSPAPLAALVVHLAAAGIWTAGLTVLAWTAIVDPRADRAMRDLVPRFSALALVAVALVALSGVYDDWVQTRAWPSAETPYEATLLIKIGFALGAFAFGAANYFDGGRGHRRLGGLRLRLGLEASLAFAVLAVTGVLVSGSPPAQERPIAIASSTNPADVGAPAPTFALSPGRPGPTRFEVSDLDVPGGRTVELDLQRLDGTGSTRMMLRPTGLRSYVSDGGLLPAGSAWDASVVTRDDAGTETGRWRYSFALDSVGITEGRAVPPLDPGDAVAALMAILALLLGTFSLAGGVLPRTDPRTSRVAALTGAVVAAALAGILLVGGIRT